MKLIAIILGIILVMPALGQRKKKDEEVVIQPHFVEGVAYSLPRTGLRFYVKALKETFEPGPYAAYAQQLLGINSVKTIPETKWVITEVRIEAFTEPDPAQIYKAVGDPAIKINLLSDGRIAGINLPNVTSQPLAVRTNKVIQLPDEPDDFSFDYFTDTPFYTEGDSTNNYRPVRIGSEKKAAEAAKRVLEARMYQYDIASGMLEDLPPDGEAYKVSLEELSNVEKNYVSLFTGRTIRKEDVFSFIYIPESLTDGGEVIFRISDENGVVPADDLSGKPVMIEFLVDEKLREKYQTMAESDNPDAGESGVYYRMPVIADIRIISDLKTIATARIPVAQFGVVAPVPEEMVQGDYMITYHTETGAIKSIYKR